MPINKETIISVFNDKLTLEQWLKTINKALDEAVLTGVEITKKGNATLSFKFTFEDGTFLESNDLVLQQGESVENAYIEDGHLFLTLTNGQDLDAGNIKPVYRFAISAEQHLIVFYQDGTNQDLGAIFNGNISISGTITASGDITSGNNIEANNKITGKELYINKIDTNTYESIYVEKPLNTTETHITALKPIIEQMEGYSASINSDLDTWLKDIIYVGACKNGNKLTLVACFKLTKTSASASNPAIIDFTIPNAIGSKLYPAGTGGGAYLDQKAVPCWYTGTEYVTCPMRINKISNVLLRLIIRDTNLVQDQEYIMRYEATFLLSDNLIGA